MFLTANHAKNKANLIGWRENPQYEGDIIGLLQVWELPYRQCPSGLIDTKGNEKNIFQKKNWFFARFEVGCSFSRLREWEFSNPCGYSRKKWFFRNFAYRMQRFKMEIFWTLIIVLRRLTRQWKAWMINFWKSNIQGPFEYSTSPESS